MDFLVSVSKNNFERFIMICFKPTHHVDHADHARVLDARVASLDVKQERMSREFAYSALK